MIYTKSETFSSHFSGSPQFLYNTKDRSQIASARLIYQPSFSLTNDQGEFVFNVNNPSIFPEPRSIFRLLFDIRSDNGYYVRKGDITDPSLHTSFFRIGSKFGFSWTLLDYSLTLKATETLLYGYIGTKRELDYFDVSLSYDLDPKGYFSLALGYQKGRDEDTTEPVQTWTLGFTAKY